METVLGFFQEFTNLDAAILLSVVTAISGKFLGMKLDHVIKSGLLVGTGFQGLALAINLLTIIIQSVIDYYKALGSGYDALEVGFVALRAVFWAVPFAVSVTPAVIIVNLILACLKAAKVLNADTWNFMCFPAPGALAYALSGDAVIGFLVAVGCGVVALSFSQWPAPKWGEFSGLEETICTMLAFCAWVYPITYGLSKIIDLIPGLRDVDVNVDKLGKKLGIFGDPAVIGLLVGVFLALLTRQDLEASLTIGMGVATSMVLIPRMVSAMVGGLILMGNAASDHMYRKIGDNVDIYIGMDITLRPGDPTCITCSAIMMPVTILLAFLIPDVRLFPLGILAEVCYLAPICVLTSKGDIFRTLICMTVMMFITLFFANMPIPEITQMLSVTGVKFERLVTASHFDWNPGNLLVSLLHRLLGMPG